MIGVLPIGCQREGFEQQAALFWSPKPADFPRWQTMGLDVWKNTVRHHWPETEGPPSTITDASQMGLAAYDHHTPTSRLPLAQRFLASMVSGKLGLKRL